MNEASGVTLASSTPRCSTTIRLILSAISLIGSATPELLFGYGRYLAFFRGRRLVPVNEASPHQT
jgi:hypothetical protein